MTKLNKEQLFKDIKDENNSVKNRKNAILKVSTLDDPDVEKILNYYSGSDHEIIRFYARWALKKRQTLELKNPNDNKESPNSLELADESVNSCEEADFSQKELLINRKEKSPEVKNKVLQEPVVNKEIIKDNSFIMVDESDSSFKFPAKFSIETDDFDNLQKIFWTELETEKVQSKIVYKIRMASELEDKTYIAPLILLLEKTDDEHVVATIISALGIFNDSKYTDLVSAYLNYPDNRVIANSIEALGEIGNRNSIEIILPFINSEDNRIKANTAKALYKFDTELVLDIIEGMIESKSLKEKRSAVHALGCMTDQRSLALLKRLLAMDIPDITVEAAELIDRIEEKIRIKKERTAKYRAIVKDEKGSLKASEKKDKIKSKNKKNGRKKTLNFKKYAGMVVFLTLALGLVGTGLGIYIYYPEMITKNIDAIKSFINNNMKELEERDLSIGKKDPDPVVTQKIDSSKPVVDAKPNKTIVKPDEPVKPDKPVKLDKPAKLDKPVESDKPVKLDKPVESDKPVKPVKKIVEKLAVKSVDKYFSDKYLKMIESFNLEIPDKISEKQILKGYLDLVIAYNEKDLKRVGDFYSADYKFAENNRKATIATVKEEFNFGPEIQMKIEKITISSSDTIANVEFVYYLEGSAGDGFEIEKDFSLTSRKDKLRLETKKWIITRSE